MRKSSKIKKNCEFCGKEFLIFKCLINVKKFCSRPCYNKSLVKKVCLNGHDVTKCGRANGRGCNQCIKDKHPGTIGHPKVQFCPRGHDTAICGRTNTVCNICKDTYWERVGKERIRNDFSPKRRYSVAKHLAYRRKTKLLITLEEFTKLISQPCYYCNKSLIYEHGASIDRIDNEKGYSLDNLLPCCNDCNKARNTMYTVEEFKVMMTACLEYRKTI
jgi:hypothetical protein